MDGNLSLREEPVGYSNGLGVYNKPIIIIIIITRRGREINLMMYYT